MDKKQKIQNKEYEYPYHYIPVFKDGKFSQTQHWCWGFRYLGGLHVVREFLNNITFNSLIDVGCGDGRFLREIRKHYVDAKLLGVDYSKQAIDIAKVMNPQIRYDNINILEETLDDVFDVATAIEVLEHIPSKDLPGFVKAISSLIKNEGYFILTVPHQNKAVSPKHYQHFSSSKLDQLLSSYFNEVEFVPFDNRSKVMIFLSKIIGGNGENFVITNNSLNNWFFNLYLEKYLYTESEEDSLRIAAICKK